MKNNRRNFLKITGAAGIGVAGNMFKGFAALGDNHSESNNIMASTENLTSEKDMSIIGF